VAEAGGERIDGGAVGRRGSGGPGNGRENRMSTILEKLILVREAEERAAHVVAYYRRMAEETVSRARVESDKLRQEEEARAREEGEKEMREIIEHAGTEGEELRVEYMYDRMRLLSVVVERRKDAVAFLVDRLERGEEEIVTQGRE